MRSDLTSFDLLFLVPELRNLIGGRIQKVYQDGKIIRIEIFISGKGTFELYFEPGKIFISEYKRKSPEVPESFAMLLRKHMSGKIITDIYQHNFDRIIELKTDEHILIFELFSKGNVILCDPFYKIIMPLEVQIWKDRKLVPKEKYEYPPEVINPFSLDMTRLKMLFQNEKELVRFLATNLSFSGTYAEELCLRAEIQKDKICNDLSESEIEKIYEAIQGITNDFSPRIIFKDNSPIDVVPIKMKLYESFEQQEFKSFTTALDEYFTHGEMVKEEIEKKKELTREIQKLNRIVEEQKEKIEKWKRIEKESKKAAELIYNNFDLVEKIITGLKKARESGMSWDQIKSKIEEEDTPEAKAIKEIREDDGKVILDLGAEVEIDFRKSVTENAQDYFEDAKWAKNKLEATRKALRKTRYQIKKIEKKGIEKKVKKPSIKKRRKRGKWYESYRWMFTTDGFLVVAGKDARQNEILFKKHIDPNDIILHAEITGAPLTVIKSEGKEITPLAVREAGEFAAAYSSAWKRKLGSVEVYWARPDKVTKQAPAGEFLPKGSFMFKEKNYLKKLGVKLAVGVKFEKNKNGEIEAKVIAGNVQSINKHAKYFVTIIPGHMSQLDIAKAIKLKILEKALPEDKPLIEELDIEEFQRFLPSGESDIVER